MKEEIYMSVCIPVYNGVSRIAVTLQALDRAISLVPSNIMVEILVVDNASTDGTAECAYDFWRDLPSTYLRRCVHESQQGIGYARLKAWTEARGDIIIFCDDDVSPDAESLANISNTAEREISVGGGGGVITGILDGQAQWPLWFDDVLKSNLALNKDSSSVAYGPPGDYLPVGAFVWFRREALRAWVEYMRTTDKFVLGVSGKKRWPGDDQEMDIIVQRAGWKLKYDPAIRAIHRIPASRLTEGNMVKLLYWNGRASMRLRNRWGNGGWFYCASRFVYYILWKRVLESISIISGWGRSVENRFQPEDSSDPGETNRRMHFVFRAGVFDEMAAKTFNPARF